MSIKGKAYIMGAFEHPTRDAPDTSTPQLHADHHLEVGEDPIVHRQVAVTVVQRAHLSSPNGISVRGSCDLKCRKSCAIVLTLPSGATIC